MRHTGTQGTVGELLALANERLARAGIPSPWDEARLLLGECLGAPLAWVMAHPEAEVLPDRRLLFLSMLERRVAHEPVAYITGHKEFFGLDLEVGPAVLIPRPETELLVERALAAANRLAGVLHRDLLAADLGTGSGAVAIALAAREPRLRLIAVDTSAAALEIARRNALRHRVADRIEFRQGDLLAGGGETLDLLVANLPYIPSREIAALMPDVRDYEPREALDGGPDGTVPVRRALDQAASRMGRPAALLFEIGDGQGDLLVAAARRLYPDAVVRVDRDHAGFERILTVELGRATSPPAPLPRGEGSEARTWPTFPPSPAGKGEGGLGLPSSPPSPTGKGVDVPSGTSTGGLVQSSSPVVPWPADAEAQRALIARAAALILAGEVVAFPTDTVYGIGAHAWNEEAVRRLYAIKERPPSKAIALLISGAHQLFLVTDYRSPALEELARRFWPGGLTLVVPWRSGVEGRRGQPFTTVGVRVPNHPIALALIEAVGSPLATTSANLSGAPSPTTAAEVERQIGDRIALIVDGGACTDGRDSTVVDLTTDPPTVRRPGAVAVPELEAVLGQVRLDT